MNLKNAYHYMTWFPIFSNVIDNQTDFMTFKGQMLYWL